VISGYQLRTTRTREEDEQVASVYEIVVKGELGPTVACAFEGMQLEARQGETAIVGDVADQAQLAGLLRRVSDLGLSLISVTQLPARTTATANGG
jgi:hypothetical protein